LRESAQARKCASVEIPLSPASLAAARAQRSATRPQLLRDHHSLPA